MEKTSIHFMSWSSDIKSRSRFFREIMHRAEKKIYLSVKTS